MATDAWVAFPQYAYDGYHPAKGDQLPQIKWGAQTGTIYVQVTHDGDQLVLLLQNVLRDSIAEWASPPSKGVAIEPEYLSARLVHAAYNDSFSTVLISVTQPTEENIEYRYTVDVKSKTVTVLGPVDRVYNYDQFLRKIFPYTL